MSESNIEIQAEYYSNIPILDRDIKASVHLENEEDELFWDTMLQAHRPGRYFYIYYSRSGNGNDTRGCEQCLKYKQYLSNHFFICIDSDLRHLRKEQGIDAGNFIHQTYCYSWENHYCFAERLQRTFAAKCPDVAELFDFRIFLAAYSAAVYEASILFLAMDRKEISGFSLKDFKALLPQQCSHNNMANNGEDFNREMKKKIMAFTSPLIARHHIDMKAEKIYYQQLGLTESNAYLHIRGHELYNLVEYIGKYLCRSKGINFTDEILLDDIQMQGYWEVEKIGEDIRSF